MCQEFVCLSEKGIVIHFIPLFILFEYVLRTFGRKKLRMMGIEGGFVSVVPHSLNSFQVMCKNPQWSIVENYF